MSQSGRELHGVHVAIVRHNDDPEGLGRVKLEYPWRESQATSGWARVAVPMAGPDRGTYFLPEPGDEVLVAFAGADIDHPYVVGALWNGEDGPPEANHDGDNDRRGIVSRNGHQLIFDDDDAGGCIRIETAGGSRVVLDDADGGSETISIEDAGGNRIELDGGRNDLSISSNGTISIDATGIEISSGGKLDITAGGVLSLNGAMIQLN